jgi:hypothetical protein
MSLDLSKVDRAKSLAADVQRKAGPGTTVGQCLLELSQAVGLLADMVETLIELVPDEAETGPREWNS